MKRGIWGLGLVLCVIGNAVGEVHESYAAYHAAYEERMAEASTKKEVVFLTTRYDGALEKLVDDFVKAGKIDAANGVMQERVRIRGLDKVQAARVQLPMVGRIRVPEPEVQKPKISLFGIETASSRPVFLIMSGPAITMPREGQSLAAARMGFHIVQTRLAETIESLPETASFNAAAFWHGNTSPFLPDAVPANPGNKARYIDWSMPMNAINVEGSYHDFIGRSSARLAELGMNQKLDAGNRSGAPGWLYDYKPSGRISAFFSRDDWNRHWMRALCFALEQEADSIFLISSNNVFRGDALSEMVRSLEQAAESIYGKGNLPEIHLVISRGTGRTGGSLEHVESSFSPLQRVFDGDAVLINKVERWMTADEKDLFDSL